MPFLNSPILGIFLVLSEASPILAAIKVATFEQYGYPFTIALNESTVLLPPCPDAGGATNYSSLTEIKLYHVVHENSTVAVANLGGTFDGNGSEVNFFMTVAYQAITDTIYTEVLCCINGTNELLRTASNANTFGMFGEAGTTLSLTPTVTNERVGIFFESNKGGVEILQFKGTGLPNENMTIENFNPYVTDEVYLSPYAITVSSNKGPFASQFILITVTLEKLMRLTATKLDADSWGENCTITPYSANFTGNNFDFMQGKLAAADDTNGNIALFYIGTDQAVYFLNITNPYETSITKLPWVKADDPSGSISAAYSEDPLKMWVVYVSGGEVVQYSFTDGAWEDDSPQKLYHVYTATSETLTTSTATATTPSKSTSVPTSPATSQSTGLSKGAAAAIGASLGFIGLSLLALAAFCLYLKKKNRPLSSSRMTAWLPFVKKDNGGYTMTDKPELHGEDVKPRELDGHERLELDEGAAVILEIAPGQVFEMEGEGTELDSSIGSDGSIHGDDQVSVEGSLDSREEGP